MRYEDLLAQPPSQDKLPLFTVDVPRCAALFPNLNQQEIMKLLSCWDVATGKQRAYFAGMSHMAAVLLRVLPPRDALLGYLVLTNDARYTVGCAMICSTLSHVGHSDALGHRGLVFDDAHTVTPA